MPYPTVALVGYTNSGKSTLMNRLTAAGVLVEDKLFATLDPTVRRLNLPSGGAALLIDTVGFINKLPHGFVDAFKSTLEEVRTADLLLHVVDASNPHAPEQMQVVERVLGELQAGAAPRITVLNKIDLLPPGHRPFASEPDRRPISARTGEGIPELLRGHRPRLAGAGASACTSGCPPAEATWWRACTRRARCCRRSIATARSRSPRWCRRSWRARCAKAIGSQQLTVEVEWVKACVNDGG